MTAPALSLDDAIATYGEDAVRAPARHAMWRAADLSYMLHEGQLRARSIARRARAVGQRFVLNTGRRWGKTRFFSAEAAELCVAKPGARVVYAAPTETQVSEFVLPHWHMMREHAPPELRPEPRGGDWIFPNGSRVVIGGCEDRKKADRLRGPAADLCILDEAGFVSIADYVVRSVLGPQLWTTGGQMLVSSTPPESPDHPFVALLEEAQAAGAYYHETTAQAPHMTPALLAKAIEDCGGVDTIAWRREGLAEIIVDPTQTVLPEFSEHERAIVAEHPRPEYYLPHSIGDVGFIDTTVIAHGYYDFRAGVAVIEDETVARQATSARVDELVAERERTLWGSTRVHRRRADASPMVLADMSREVWQQIDDEDPVRHWVPVTRGDMEAGANEARILIKRGKVRIHPRCRTIIAHARFARWNRQRTSFERPESAEHHYDGAAALIYFLRDVDRVTNPYPAIPAGVTHDDHYIPPALIKKRSAERDVFFGRRR